MQIGFGSGGRESSDEVCRDGKVKDDQVSPGSGEERSLGHSISGLCCCFEIESSGALPQAPGARHRGLGVRLT